jgi:alkylation response protein AidB-like acyl-CoA dehydrogenase
MADYLNDGILLYLRDLVDWEGYYRLRRGDDADVEAERAALETIVETMAGICQGIEPEAREAWEEPAKLVDGEVVVPQYIEKAYEMFREAGLVSVGVNEKYGGYDLPSLVANMLLELASRASPALMTVLGLQAGAANDIQKYGSEDLRKEYLPKFVSGEVQGSMDLTEPEAGSDLGGITTRVFDEGGKTYVDGEKIYITNGGADIHLVLAREAETFDESKGSTKGLSLLLCPRALPDGSPNSVSIDRLEHKLGFHNSPTAVVRFSRAEAFRMGKKGDGFKAMLDLMNQARLGVAAQGIGIAEGAVQEAIAYARQRNQFGGPIANLPLMKNMLARMVIAVEGSRALLYRVAVLIDRNGAIEAYLEREPDISEGERAELQSLRNRNSVQIRLMTPLAKYLGTESCDWVTRMAIQVHGGVGFMAESVVGRMHLDGIVLTIYEGTSEIQVSFALREIGKGALGIVFEEIEHELSQLKDDRLAPFAEKVRKGMQQIQEASAALLQGMDYALLSARLEAEAVIDVIVAAELLRQADAAPRRFDLAASWVNRKMSEVEGHTRRIAEGDESRLERCERIIELFE